MSGKLDQSLDQIMQDGPRTGSSRRGRGGRRPPPRRAAKKANAAIVAPTGGVQKNSRGASKAITSTLSAPSTGESKIIVSNLPEDVTETQIKDYFGKSISRVRYANLQYMANGRSRGIATIVFSDPAAGPKAAKQLDGVKVDNKPMKIEVVLGAKHAPLPPVAKSLADRVSQPKNAASKDKPKSAAGAKATVSNTNGATKGKAGRGAKAGRSGRPKKKTAEELDAEMMDYFGGDAPAANGISQPAAAAAANGDTGMVDEVL